MIHVEYYLDTTEKVFLFSRGRKWWHSRIVLDRHQEPGEVTGFLQAALTEQIGVYKHDKHVKKLDIVPRNSIVLVI